MDDVKPPGAVDERVWTISASLVPAAIGASAVAAWWASSARAANSDLLLAAGIGLIGLAGALAVLRRPVREERDYYGGLVLFAVALFLLWAAGDLPGMRGFAFGPGTGPRIFAAILAGLALAVAVTGLFSQGPTLDRYDLSAPVLLVAAVFLWSFARTSELKIMAAICLAVSVALAIRGLLGSNRSAVRGPLFITLGTLLFALTIRQLGLVIASYLTIVTVSAGSSEVRWLETLMWAGVLTLFCVLVFPIALNLPLQMWPQPTLSWSTILNFR